MSHRRLSYHPSALLDTKIKFFSSNPNSPKALRPVPNIPINPANALILRFHCGNVFCCKWSHDGSKLSTASADGTAITYTIGNDAALDRKVLGVIQRPPERLGITTIDWNRDSRFFATGSFGTTALISQIPGHSSQRFPAINSPCIASDSIRSEVLSQLAVQMDRWSCGSL
jgi:WD40 repeat protein